jgi:hypothetical protein
LIADVVIVGLALADQSREQIVKKRRARTQRSPTAVVQSLRVQVVKMRYVRPRFAFVVDAIKMALNILFCFDELLDLLQHL